MPDWPKDEKAREVQRGYYLEYHMQEAQRRARRTGVSSRCGRGDHGCLNDGSSCLCLCHDRNEDGTQRWPGMVRYGR